MVALAPYRAKSTATARPIPLSPLLISATLPSSFLTPVWRGM